MEQPAKSSGDGDAPHPRAPQVLIEKALRETANAERIAGIDLWLATRFTADLIAHMRKVAPEFVAECEREVGLRW